MKIKRIDVCGFKSFCDKSHLDMQQPITAIVGPNGCGKSNVVDALLWAMGEQRAKHLRGRAMEDIIFNGSESRGPAGMAEVSITFENTKENSGAGSWIAAGVSDFEEITVTRRLHRDGTSEYLINKIPVRLRDISNLFLGTGIGSNAYSIIEQGRVSRIVSSKPEERRHLIEEAAGITKYRKRRQVAERRMEATRQNLLRIGDVLEEIEKRLGSLRRQAQKAERYKSYKDEMRDIDLWAASHRLLELTATTKLVDVEYARVTEQRETATHQLQQAELDIETARLTLSEQERELNALQESSYQLENRVKLNENRVDFESREAEDLTRRAEQSKGEVDELVRQVEADTAQEAEVKQRAETLQLERDEWTERSRHQELALKRCREDLKEVEAAIEAERDALQRAEREGLMAQEGMRAAVQRHDDIVQQLDRRSEQLEDTRERMLLLQENAATLSSELDALGVDRETLAQKREEAKTRLMTLRKDADHSEAELEVLRTELHRRRSRMASLEEIQARYEGFGHGTRAVMQRHNGSSREKGVLGVVADIIDTAPEYEVALESVLGQRLGTVIVESENVGVDAIQYLKDGALGRSSFIVKREPKGGLLARAPVGFVWDGRASGGGSSVSADGLQAASDTSAANASFITTADITMADVTTADVTTDEDFEIEPKSVKNGPMLSFIGCETEYAGVAEALLGDVFVVEDLRKAMSLWGRSAEKTIVTLDGDILEPDGTVTGGSRDAELSGILQQKREIKELSEIIADIQQQYDHVHHTHVHTRAEIAALERTLNEVTQKEHEGEKAVLAREKDARRVEDDLEDLHGRSLELEQETETQQRSISSLKEEQARLAEKAEQSEVHTRLSRDILGLLRTTQRKISDEVNEVGGRLTETKVFLAQANTQWQATDNALKQLVKVCAERRERIERLQANSCEGLERAEQLRENVITLKEELTALIEQRADLQDRIEEGRTVFEHAAEDLAESEGQLKTLRSTANSLADAQHKLQLKCNEVAMDRRRLDEQVQEKYRLDIARVAGDYHLRSPISKQEYDRLDQLRQLIHRMGEINLTAIDEYNELSERFEFLNGHRTDLEGALGQLQRAIQRINRTCRQRFVETFEAVDKHFREVFSRLFRGGKARLQLTEAEDVLQGGVEIVAQPPGKKLVSIEMMSGGEKALTATSLVFAMFLVRPAPFCLLDEVDAPLDDSNVLRLRDLVQEMSNWSQFIVITHNHSTMEMADRLYGVTMEEAGCSKLVSVNLNEARKVAA